MGYTHYFYTKKHLDNVKFVEFSRDVARALDNINIPLVAEYDDPSIPPVVNDNIIHFNGVGDEGHETFVFLRDSTKAPWQTDEGDKVFHFCKTQMKPYDLAVTVCLVLAKYHFREDVKITSDGDACDWEEAIKFVNEKFGYNMIAEDGCDEIIRRNQTLDIV